MPAITTSQIGKDELDEDLHKEYFAEDQDGGYVSANSNGYMEDLETNFTTPSGITADVIIILTAVFYGTSSSGLYPYSPVTYGIELDGTELRDTTIRPLTFRNDSGVSSYRAINGNLVAGKKNISSGTHNVKIPYSTGDSRIYTFCRSVQVIVFYK
jgi:hypothetical protein